MWNKFLEMLGFVWVRQRDEQGKYIPDNKKPSIKMKPWEKSLEVEKIMSVPDNAQKKKLREIIIQLKKPLRLIYNKQTN